MAGDISKDPTSTLNAFDSEIQGSSYSLSFPSEPPDIRNWFSSYEYESPASDEDLDVKKYENSRRFENIECRDVSDFCKSSYDKESCPIIKDTVEISELPPYPKILFLKRVREEDEILQGDFKQKFDSIPLIDNIDSTVNNGNKDPVVNNVEPLERLESSSKAKIDPFQSKNKENFSRIHEKLPAEGEYIPPKSKTDSVNNGEYKEIDIIKSGFISTRNSKSTKENGGNVWKDTYIKSCVDSSARKHSTAIARFKSLEKDAKLLELVGEESAQLRRKGLSEITNFQAESVPEIPGKWLCPRKNKPYIGPPMKQIRLERWVRRVQ